MKKIKLMFAALILITNISHAIPVETKWNIIGKVIDSQTEENLPYVTVTLNLTSDSSMVKGSISDDDGNFEIEKVTKGDYYLKFSFIGFDDYYIKDMKFDKKNRIVDIGSISMSHSLALLSEVEISGEASSISNSIDKQVLNIDKNLTAQGGTAVDALKMSPSIQVDPEGKVKLRGSTKFTVLINGKPTTMSADEVLRQTPANNISDIEIITNPSVKYSAEGGAGIININLKRGVNSGLNGMLNATIGTKDKYSGDFNLNLNREKISLSLGIDWRDWNTTAKHNYFETLDKGDTILNASMLQDRLFNENNLAVRFGMDYNPNKKNNISYSFHSGYTSVEGDIKAKTSGITIPADEGNYKFNTYYFLQKPTFYTNNLAYTRQLNDKGSSLSFNAYYSYIDYYLNTFQVQSVADKDFIINDLHPYKQDIVNDNYSNDFRIDADYTIPLSEKTKFETGLSMHTYNRFLDVTYAQFNYDVNNWVNHPDYTNKYDFDEKIYAGYANVNTSFWGINASIGIRTEFMDRLLKRADESSRYEYEKWDFFPAFSLSKTLADNQSIKLAMSNRTNRPDEYMMNPFPEFEDDYFYGEGNPYLIPEIVRNVELGHQIAFDKFSLSSSLFYRQTTDKIEQRLWIAEDEKIHTSFHNDCNDRTLGLEFMANLNAISWWNLVASGSLYHYTIEGKVFEDPFKHQRVSYNMQLVNSFKIGKTTSLQLIGYYSSPTARSQGELTEIYFMDAAVQQQFMDGKLSLNLQLKDVFQSMNYQLITNSENLNLVGDFNNESPVLILSLSYQISKYKKKTRDVETEFDM